MPKIVPKSLQTCFEHVLGQTFRKILAQFSMECRVFENFQKKYFRNSKNAQKCSQKYPNVFYGDFFEKNLCPVFHGMSSIRKFSKKNIFEIPKKPKSVPKSIQTCFMVIFSKKIYAQFSMECRVFENFQRKIFSVFQKCPKVFPKVSKRVLNVLWGKLFEKLLPSFPRRVES